MQFEKILFLDVETVSQVETHSELSEDVATLWDEKFLQIKKRSSDKYDEESDAVSSLPDMGLFAEFGKIVCISFGLLYKRGEEDIWTMRVSSVYGFDEVSLLTQFGQLLVRLGKQGFRLCGHNIKEFDVPYIARRMLIHNMQVPKLLLDARRKPWESQVIDTMDMWKFGDYKHYTSLKLLCKVLNVQSPKEDMEGKDVYRVYYQEHDPERIAHYCENDVVAVARVFLRLSGANFTLSDEVERCPFQHG